MLLKSLRLFTLLFIVLALSLSSCLSRQPMLPKLKAGDVILAFGDSLTYGTGTSHDQSYPAVLQKITGFKVINAGVPGEKTAGSLKRLPTFLKAYHPALVLLCIGGNDIIQRHPHEEIADNIKQLVEMILQAHASVVLIAVPGFNLFVSPPDFYEDIGRQYHVPVIENLLPQLLRTRDYKSDSIHLNRVGYAEFAKGIAQFLQKRGALPQ